MLEIVINCDGITLDDDIRQLVSDLCEAVGKANGIGEITMICDGDQHVLWDLTVRAYVPQLDFMDEE